MAEGVDCPPNEDDLCVRVAVKIRPMLGKEIAEQCQPCLCVTANGTPQVRAASIRNLEFACLTRALARHRS
jgi:hypothetical protein